MATPSPSTKLGVLFEGYLPTLKRERQKRETRTTTTTTTTTLLRLLSPVCVFFSPCLFLPQSFLLHVSLFPFIIQLKGYSQLLSFRTVAFKLFMDYSALKRYGGNMKIVSKMLQVKATLKCFASTVFLLAS